MRKNMINEIEVTINQIKKNPKKNELVLSNEIKKTKNKNKIKKKKKKKNNLFYLLTIYYDCVIIKIQNRKEYNY